MEITPMTSLIPRQEYLDTLRNFRDKRLIKVISGIRRCGKSTLFELYTHELIENGVPPEHIISINFEDLANEAYLDYRALYQHLQERIQPQQKTYLFLDEIQHVAQYEKVVDSLQLSPHIDIYITGSNAYFMSGELATLLSGRYIEIKMLPLSFKEYYHAQPDGTSPEQAYHRYLTQSSFPYTLQLVNDPQAIRIYLEGLFDTIILKDIVTRYKLRDVSMLQSVIKYIFAHIGSRLSIRRIAQSMSSMGRKIDNKTLEKYICALVESRIIHEATRYNIKGKQHLKLEEKYYITDLGLRHYLLGGKNMDIGHNLENIIYLELLRRGYQVYVGKIDEYEVDFIAQQGDEQLYVQVSATVRDTTTLERELRPLRMIKDHYPKYLLTLDNDPAGDYDGIRRVNALDWLLDH